jgi:membrane fusion protein (multidrug efflux system)
MSDNSSPDENASGDRREAAPEKKPAEEKPPEEVSSGKKRPSRGRRLGFEILGGVVVLAALGYGLMRFLAGAHETTNDAYVAGNVVTITARQAGTVLALHADNTQRVEKGQPLIDLDPAPTDVQLAAAEAALGRAVREVRSNTAEVGVADAELVQAKADLERAVQDLSRRKQATAGGAVSGEELAHATAAAATAQAALDLAQAKREQAASAVAGTAVANNPRVLAAIADLRQAAINSSYMNIVAPVSGVVAQRTVQLGQQVAAGEPLMAVVPLDNLWVDANFREPQLRDLRVGQPVVLRADVYGRRAVFHGRVQGLGAGSGSAFSLLPPQNASGNWIKIVQRLPVRITLDPEELEQNPLRVGLSMKVTVDTHDQSGPLAAASAPPFGPPLPSFEGGPALEQRIRGIIEQNLAEASVGVAP